MTEPALGFRTRLARYIGTAIDGPKFLGRYIAIGTLSLAETLLELVNAHIVTDIARIKESLIRRIEAETDEKRAEADRKTAEAAEAANRATLHKRQDAIAKAERQQKQAEAAKTEAEADAIRADAETRRIEAVAGAQARLLEAIAKLRKEGGDVFFSKDNLQQILRLGLPAADDEADAEDG
jgi:uncharacterized membrane protein YqiK